MEKEEMLELIKKADEAYYMEYNPIMTDDEYDKLHYDFIDKYGELNYVPGGVKKGLEPFKHPTEVISLAERGKKPPFSKRSEEWR